MTTPDLIPNHPAVEAALIAGYGQREETFAPEMAAALSAALPHLTADDLRNTPAGRALMAEAWDMGWAGGAYGKDRHDNPYPEGDA